MEQAYETLRGSVAVTEPDSEKSRRMEVSIAKRKKEIIEAEERLLELVRDYNIQKKVVCVIEFVRAVA